MSSDVKKGLSSIEYLTIIISFLSLGVSIFSWYETSKQVELTRGQVRSYVQVTNAELVYSINEATFIEVKLTFKNFGQTAAVNLKGNFGYEVGHYTPPISPSLGLSKELGNIGPGMERTVVLIANKTNFRDWPAPDKTRRRKSLFFMGTLWYTDDTSKDRKYDDWSYELVFSDSSAYSKLTLEETKHYRYTSNGKEESVFGN